MNERESEKLVVDLERAMTSLINLREYVRQGGRGFAGTIPVQMADRLIEDWKAAR